MLVNSVAWPTSWLAMNWIKEMSSAVMPAAANSSALNRSTP
jgi:hypothetical protein